MRRYYTLISISIFSVLFLTLSACQQKDASEPQRNTQTTSTVESDTPVTIEQINEPDIVEPEPRNSALRYVGWAVDDSSDTPRACFEFYTPLDADDTVALRDYYEVTPDTRLALSVDDKYLCLSGFDYDEDYTVVLKSGLMDKADNKLTRNISESVSFGDKPAFVGFAGDGIILPRVNAQGLAIETVNVDSVEVEIARVSDRMVARRDPQSGRTTLEGDYSWEYEDAASNIRDVIWSGDIDVENERNRTVTTVIPIANIVGELEPGAYVVTAEREHDEDENRVAKSWRWIISTDLAITSYWGDNGLTASVRSIDTAKLKSGIELVLVAQNNDVLASTQTDTNGYAEFARAILAGTGPKQPKILMAYGSSGDYAMLDLSRAPLDLSEYDIDGRQASGRVDIYGFPERGVYRPGETAHFTVMSRDSAGLALYDTPLTLTVTRPNGIDMFSQRIETATLAETAGTLVCSYDIPDSAPRGVWTLNVKADGADKSERIEFSVEDFVPQKLKLEIDTADTPIRSGEIRDVSLDAQFLYGAPGAALEGHAEARVRIDPSPFADFSNYSFGPAEKDFRERFVEMGGGVTDGKGLLTVALDLKNNAVDSDHPLRAEITAGVAEPGGRYVRESTRIPIRTENIYLGLDPQFEGRRVQRGKPAKFNLIAVNANGAPVATSVTWRLIEEDWDYHWYRENGRWRYRRDVRDIPLSEGNLDIATDGSAEWSDQLSWGNYRLDLVSDDGVTAGHRFSVGWAQSSQTDSPDQLSLALDNDKVASGDMINMVVNAPYAGEAELVIANDKVRMVRPISLKAGGSNLSFKLDDDWGKSLYAMITLYTPRDVTARPVPRRAVGIAHIDLDRSGQTLDLDIDAPEILRPNTSQVFTVNVEGASKKAWVNFAAVDEGILRLTKYNSPDAPGYFFGKKALGVDMRDDYGRILNANLGAPAIVKSGGDSLGGEGLTVVPTKTVAMFSGPVDVKNGKAEITLDLPQFNGELRLMATAWSETSMGSTSESVKLRDKLPAIVGLPRFLAPGDEVMATVSLDNVEGTAGTYNVSMISSNAVMADGEFALDLSEGQRREGMVPLGGVETGIDDIRLSISGPDYKANADYPIQVRSPYMPITRAETRLLEPGGSFSVGSDLVSEFVKGSTDVTVSFSRLPGIDPAPYVNSLARYPYGCTEQTVSTAMPLLYADNLGGIPGQTEAERRRGLNRAIAKLSNRQSLDGAFGLWSAGDSYARPWLGVYVTDFLYRAKEDDLYVSEDVLKRASKALREISRMPRYPGINYDFPTRSAIWRDQHNAEVAAYAHYVLARTGQGDLGQMRYFFDNPSGYIQSPLAQAYITAALKMMGDERRAQQSLARMMTKMGYADDNDYYQSALRDLSGAVSALADADMTDEVVALAEDFGQLLEDESYLHTNEKAHVILAINALMQDADAPKVSAKDARLAGTDKRPFAQLYGADLENNPTFTSRDKNRMWASIVVSGAPQTAPLPQAEGFTLTKTVHNLTGAPKNLANMRQGERAIIKLAFKSNINRSRTAVVADLLPAGFEIETILTPDEGNRRNGVKGPYAWVGNISSFQVTEARDDRFVASLETYRRDEYIAAYIVRAVTPGNFVMPGAVLEDMYRPADVAITEAGRVTITADPTL